MDLKSTETRQGSEYTRTLQCTLLQNNDRKERREDYMYPTPAVYATGKGTDPLYAVIRSSYTLQEQCNFKYLRKSAAQFQNQIPVLKLVCNFAISSLLSANSKLRKFVNCVEHIHVVLYSNTCG